MARKESGPPRESMKLELNEGRGELIRVGGPRPYIWVGMGDDCVGCVSDRSIEKLKRWCEEILDANKRLRRAKR